MLGSLFTYTIYIMHNAAPFSRRACVHLLSCVVVPFTPRMKNALIMGFASELTKIIICCEICVLLEVSVELSFNKNGALCGAHQGTSTNFYTFSMGKFRVRHLFLCWLRDLLQRRIPAFFVSDIFPYNFSLKIGQWKYTKSTSYELKTVINAYTCPLPGS